jgi:hypothetical protein
MPNPYRVQIAIGRADGLRALCLDPKKEVHHGGTETQRKQTQEDCSCDAFALRLDPKKEVHHGGTETQRKQTQEDCSCDAFALRLDPKKEVHHRGTETQRKQTQEDCSCDAFALRLDPKKEVQHRGTETQRKQPQGACRRGGLPPSGLTSRFFLGALCHLCVYRKEGGAIANFMSAFLGFLGFFSVSLCLCGELLFLYNSGDTRPRSVSHAA